MIKNIIVGTGLQLVSGSVPYINNNGPAAGMLRYNTVTQNLEVNDGYNWICLSPPDPTLSLDIETQDLLAWARIKKRENDQLRELIDKHPGIKDLKDKLDMLTILARDDYAG